MIDSEHHHFTYGGNTFTGYFEFSDIARWLNRTRFQACVSCGHPFDFSVDAVEGYEHSGGFDVSGRKYWLYITCPKCRYQTSLVKLGVSRDEAPAQPTPTEEIMKKLVSVPHYPGPGATEPVIKAIEMAVSGDWGYHAGTEDDGRGKYAWVKGKNGYTHRTGPYYTVTHTPSGLMAATHLTKSNAQRMAKELSEIGVRWDGIEKNCDVFLRAAREVIIKYYHSKCS